MLQATVFPVLIGLVSLTNLALSAVTKVDDCYSGDKNPYLYFSTVTAYENEHGLIENATLPDCKPIQIWMIIRHGTRYPSKEEIKLIKKDLPKLQKKIIKNHKGSKCSISDLESWKLDPSVRKKNKMLLTKQGEEDLLSLGKRFKNYFPDLLQHHPNNTDKYKFRSTDSQRTRVSMERFIDGLFGNESNYNTETVPTDEDTLLRLYKNCKRWSEQPISDESNKFANGPELSQVIRNVSRRLGFKQSLSFDDVLSMYTACSYESAWYVKNRSPWCTVFTEDELKVFEYKDDLYEYYHVSYGRNMSKDVGCPPLKDMFDHFTKLEALNQTDLNEELEGIFYFSHSSMLQLLFTTMGIAEDVTPLKASNFNEMGNRNWTTSHLVPFAANLAAVFYKCDSSDKVRFYLNEKPLNYEGCEEGVCDWEYLKEKIEPIASNCSSDFCSK